MIDLSLWGLVGAIVGTAVAAVLYHLFIPHLERAMRAQQQRAETEETSDLSLSVVRRFVLAGDVIAFAVLGYWLGSMFDK
jgi:hypothetical protein